ncbi:MAG TPA: hypothetical protein VF250_08520 [Conexibacter sp.]
MGDRGTWRRRLPAWLGERPHVAAALLLALPVLAYLWPVLLGGKVLTPLADLYGSVPWQSYAPRDVGSFQNVVLVDIPHVLHPWHVLVRRSLHDGALPTWSPYALGGAPLYANPQTGLFSLFNVPLWILPLLYAAGVSAALKLLVGAYGTYRLAQRYGLGFLPGLLAGVAFAFSAINVVWLTHAELPGVLALLPWALLFVERLLAGGRARDALGLALVTAIGLGGGHPGMQVHLLAVTGLYALLRIAWRERGAAGASAPPLRAAALVAGGLAAGTLLMAFMLLPEARSASDTVGVLARRAELLPGQRIPLDALQTIAFPDRWGRPSAFEDIAHSPFGVVNYNERTFYAGTVALLLACVGLLAPGGWSRKGPLALLALLGLAVPLRAPGLHWAMTHLPGLDLVEPQRIHFAYALAVALLAAFGLRALLDARALGRRSVAVPVGAALAAALVVVTAGISARDVGDTARHFATGADFARGGVLALTSVAWFLLFALAVGAGLLLARRGPRWRTGVAVALVALAAADAYHFAHGYQPMAPRARAMPPTTPALALLERHRDDGRVVGVEGALPPDTAALYGLRDVRGYDPPQPTRRLLALWRLANPVQLDWAPLELPLGALNGQSLRVLGVLGVRRLLLPPGVQLPSGPASGLRGVYAGPDATIAENARAAPRAMVPSRVLPATSSAAAHRLLLEARFDPRTDVTVAAAGARDVAAASGSAAIARDAPARVELRADLARGGLVVLGDALLDGWSVTVDGAPAAPLRVDEVMRGVVVPAGRHTVVWSYAVPGLRAGAIVSLLTALGLAGVALALALRATRRASTRLRP